MVSCVTREATSEAALRLLETWLAQRAVLVAPSFMLWEVGSVLKKKVHRGLVSPPMGQAALEAALELGVTPIQGAAVTRTAWRLAHRLGLPVLYDASYLAVAEITNAEFWTADKQLVRSLGERLSYVRLLNPEADLDAGNT